MMFFFYLSIIINLKGYTIIMYHKRR
eukprot:UN12866